MTCAVGVCKEPRLAPWYVCKEHFLVLTNKQKIDVPEPAPQPEMVYPAWVPSFARVRA